MQRNSIMIRTVLAVTALLVVASSGAQDTPNEFAKLNWQRGPAVGQLTNNATISIPAQGGLLNETETSKFLQLTGNLPSPGSMILTRNSWWASLEFSPAGYVKDDEKINPDELLKQLKDGDEPSNSQRRKSGLAELYSEAWYIPPHYDSISKHLEWALRLRASNSNEPIINYTVRLLGRSGYEVATLVSTPASLDTDVADFKQVLTSFNFGTGQSYGEYRAGDRVAEFGLAALVAGGAVAVAAKTGFWKVLLAGLAASWKLVIAAGAAIVAGVTKIFKRKQT